ncbi:CDK-activating kinase assembly factor MAT1 [Fasciola hepatica]|uniref:CDK-activating kinase assembly factor MAT1 n=1 Tax=Fasciola hepatica TaxID=6192 RepID=A0A4E0RBP1_FASHE|nr:CDK-activating kinase assembly factor MAT1 [Fasciola hepatica]
MQDQSQSCPSCRANKYNNPQLKLMVNVCGHSLCENCVEVLFARGSGLCVQCKTPIRKANFRYQLFEDPLVQKEVELRKKILTDFNKREDDFDSLEEYDIYLEKIEEIVFNLMNDVDVDETKRYIEQYKKENKDIIKRNRLRPSASMAFYEAELEREASLQEQREREDQTRRDNLTRPANPSQANTTTTGSHNPTEAYPTPASALPTDRRDLTTPFTALKRPPLSTYARPIPPSELSRTRPPAPPSQFAYPTPISAMPGRVDFDRGFLPPAPPSAFNSTTPMVTPVSAMPGMGTMSAWNLSAHHTIHLPPRGTQPRQQDTVLIPSRGQSSRASSTGAVGNGSTTLPAPFKYEPYMPDMCGPNPPGENHVRWSDLVELYQDSVIRPLRGLLPEDDWKFDSLTSASGMRVKAEPDTESIPQQQLIKSEYGVSLKPEDESMDVSKPVIRRGISYHLPRGACGIAPKVFLERCVQESRCGLFL